MTPLTQAELQALLQRIRASRGFSLGDRAEIRTQNPENDRRNEREIEKGEH